MRHYYINLPKENQNIRFDINVDISTAIQKTAEQAFSPFETYLDNAICNLKKKDDVKANWIKINENNLAELQLEGRLFEIPAEKFHYKIITGDDFKPDFSEEIKYKSENQKGSIKITEDQWNNKILDLDFREENFSRVIWGFDDIELQLVQEKYNQIGIIIKKDDCRQVVYIKDKEIGFLPQNRKEIQGNKLESYIDFDSLKYENGEKFSFIERDILSISLKSDSDYDKIVVCGKLRFKIKRPNRRDKDFYWIQLLDIDDDNQGDDNQILSPLRYFFDDDIEIRDDNKKSYEVAAGKEDENKIVLRKKGGRYYDYCFPEGSQGKDGSKLTVKVNTYQLEKQLDAISTLKNLPVKEHVNLIRLFNNKSKTHWQCPENNFITNWEVLADDNRNGCKEQRNFVNKALNTPDFAILEGPPGSGKTTVILELICQIIKQGKRILLCGSTHVAIDNVLERLKDQKLLDKFNILPVRIGDENRINAEIKEFQINNLIEENDISEDFLLDSANLVCGTTIGILKNPKFKNRRKSTPIVPEFDYLIIDESSKTTFQEFLVPALYAKKWILAGDCMQLSPFTDRNEIVSNISQSGVPSELQQAIFYLQKIEKCLYKNNKYNRFILPVTSEVMKFIEIELKNRPEFKNKYICLNIKNIKNISKLELYAFDVVVIENKLLKEYSNILPETHAVLTYSKWFESQHAFEHNCWQKKHNFYLKEKSKEITNSFEAVEDLNKYFVEKNWAEEIAWRIDREHQLRLIEKKTKGQNYSQQIENLLPKSVDGGEVEEKINQIAAMAFPSILESLVKGIKGRRTKVISTISDGFDPIDLSLRRETLVFQHRMHPEISKFPREQFYKEENALQDTANLNREWNYTNYKKHSVWIDVNGETKRNYNEEEVKALSQHLRKFIEFAKQNPQPEGKKWTVAVLTFYRGQEAKLRENLRKITGNENSYSDFNINNINIKLHTVDKFQGHEADIVFLSMVQTKRDGFLDNPNRLNVAITRAKFQLVILGSYNYFSFKSRSEDLKMLAQKTFRQN